MNTLKRIIDKVVVGIIFIVLCYLFLQSLFSKIELDGFEKRYFISSNKIVIVIGLIMLIGIFYLYHTHISLSDNAVKSLILVLMGINLFFILASQNVPRRDQERIIEFAAEIMQGNYEVFKPGNYLDIYPHQYGIVLFCCLLTKIAGGYNYMLFQIINVLCVTWGYYLIYNYWKKYGKERIDEVILGIGIFFPLTFYNSYVYGTLIGFVCALAAVIRQQRFLRESRKKDLLLSVIFIALAYWMKTNYIIFAVAIVLLYLYNTFFDKKYQCIIGAIGICLAVIITGQMITSGMNYLTEGGK